MAKFLLLFIAFQEFVLVAESFVTRGSFILNNGEVLEINTTAPYINCPSFRNYTSSLQNRSSPHGSHLVAHIDFGGSIEFRSGSKVKVFGKYALSITSQNGNILAHADVNMTCGQSVFDTTCLGGFTQNSTGYKDYHPRKLYKELCKLEPEEGRSLNTNFSITCTGGNPLYIVRYEFSYVLQNGLHEVLYQGSERSYRTVLLSGISTIKAVIIDGRGNKTEFSLNVKVKSIASTCEDWIRKINMYFRRGDKTLGAWSLLESLLSINGSVKKCPQLDEIVLNLTSDMKMETTQDVLKVTLLLGTMLDGMEDVSTSALLRTTNILKKIVKHIREDFRIPGSRLDSSFSAVVENVLFNLGKALKIGSQNSNFTNYDRTGFNTNINATKTLLSLKDQIIEVLRLSLKNVTTRNYTMQSKYLSITVVSLRGGEVDNFTIVAGQSRFIIPDINPVGEVISFLEMWTTPFNPFTWDQTSERVTSHVAGLEVRDEKGDIINMSDPSREITVILPLDKKTTDKILKGSTYYRRMKINHNITVQYGQSFVNVSFMPQSSDLVISKVKVISATTQNYSECENVRDKWIKRGRIHCNGNVAVSFMAINPGRYLVDAIFTVKESKMKKITQSSKPERGKATCVTIKNPPAVNEVKYISVQVSESACLFWETETSAWKTTGCRVEKVISNSGLKCACNHLTSFGGAYLVPPNDLSFVKVLQELRSPNDSGKFLVLVVLIATILLYLVAIIFARREDRRDKAKIQDSVPPVFYRSSESANCRYELTIKTGVWLGSGTTANVSFVLFGVEGRSSTLTIQQDFYAGFHPKFARGTEHKFAAILDKDLGDIYKLHVSHDNSGYNPSWFLDYIKIIPAGTDKSWKFSFDTWLSLEDESLSNECIRSPSNAQGSVTVIGILTYGKRDFSRYLLFKSLADHTESFEEVKDKTSLWNWINGSLITYLYSTNQESSELASTVIGMVRIRQLRVRKAQCPADKITNWWQQTCLESYSRKNEHSEPFHPTKGTSPLQFNRCPIPWMYKTGKELGSSSKWGRHAWYGGGGYLAELGYEEETARAITNLLQSESWVDRQTSAIVLEFSLLNSGTNILAVSSFFVEFLPTGQATVKRSINIISLYDTEAILQIFQGMCLVFFIAMVLFIIGETIAHIVRRRWRYLCSFWCLLDLGHLATSILLLVSSFMKSYLTTTSVLRLKENMFAHTSFETPLLWAEVENSLLAILTFLATLKLLQLTYFNFYTRLFSCALRIWMHDLPSFCLVLSIIFLAFLEIGVLVFGPSIGRYSSFWRAFAFQLEITLGKVRTRPIKELAEGVPIFGHVLVVSLLFSITIVLMNFFVSTLNDALAEAKTAEMDKEAEQAMTVGRPVNITVEKADGVNVAPENKDNGRKGEKIRGGEKTERGSRAILFDKVSKGLKTKAFFDEISEQLKTIDTLQLPILRLKVDKVCRRIENAIANEIDTGEPSTVNQKGKRRVHFGSSVRIPFT
ncbi:Polycystin-2 [Stylophora pistillata]|uniref:Polycystin-2 n=1 Tax=Stylophora pistillata TaxID=50429 RepID=A0A2B4RJ99_STYPI|nr:Polycystin-2 [Stylophora pistillata]